jgi:hypothetical protein
MKYKICTYQNEYGDKYFTVSKSKWGLFWCIYEEAAPIGYMEIQWLPVHFTTKEKALKQIKILKSDTYRRTKCEVID